MSSSRNPARASGAAKHGPDCPVAANIDNSFTASIKKSDTTVQKPVTQDSDRDLFGNR